MVLSNRQFNVFIILQSGQRSPGIIHILPIRKLKLREAISKCEPMPLEQQLVAHLKRESSSLLISLIKHIYLFCLRGYMTAPKLEACSYPEKILS